MPIIQLVISLLALPAILFLLFPFISLLFSIIIPRNSKTVEKEEGQMTDFACVITAYRNPDIAVALIESLLKQAYSNFFIYVVLDDCTKGALSFVSERVLILQPDSPLHSKSKSIEYALSHFKREHQAICVFDPDNLAHPDFLKVMNSYFAKGYKAVQGQRVAKNLNTVYARLDAINELYYNFTIRQLSFSIGSSSTIAGSGMAVATDLYRCHLSSPEMNPADNSVIVAEDKVLGAQLVNSGKSIAYAPEAIVFDEKVTKATQVQRQRARWINAYFKCLPFGGKLLLAGLRKASFNQFYFGLLLIAPPLFLLIIFSILMALIFLLAAPVWSLILIASLFVFIINFLLVLKLYHVPGILWATLWNIPLFMFNQVIALINVRKANKDFLVTTHTEKITIDEALQNSIN